MRRMIFAVLAILTLALAACGGGGSGSMTGAQNRPAQSLGVTFSGFGVSSALRAAQQLSAGTLVNVSMNGTVLASGTLDASHQVKFTFASVGGGARVKVSAGGLNPQIVLSRTTNGTISRIAVRSDGSMLVQSTDDQGGSAEINCTDNENQQTEVEDSNGETEGSASPPATASPSASPTAPPTCAPTPTDNPPTQSPSPSPSPSSSPA